LGNAPGPARARWEAVVAKSRRFVHISKDELDKSPPVRHYVKKWSTHQQRWINRNTMHF
jgi:hypothetical protein